MSDVQLRQSQRTAATGDLDAEARHLVARERAGVSGLTVACAGILHSGQLRRIFADHQKVMASTCTFCNGTGRVPFTWPERLTLAAYCGSEVAQILMGPGPHAWLAKAFDIAGGEVKGYLDRISGVGFSNWQHGFPYWPDAPLRAAVAAAECVLPRGQFVGRSREMPVWEILCSCGTIPDLRVWTEDVARSPARMVERNIVRLYARVRLNATVHEGACSCGRQYWATTHPSLFTAQREAVTAARRFVDVPTAEKRSEFESALELCRDGVLWIASPPGGPIIPAQAIQAAAQIATEPVVREAIQTELIGWSLGGAG